MLSLDKLVNSLIFFSVLFQASTVRNGLLLKVQTCHFLVKIAYLILFICTWCRAKRVQIEGKIWHKRTVNDPSFLVYLHGSETYGGTTGVLLTEIGRSISKVTNNPRDTIRLEKFILTEKNIQKEVALFWIWIKNIHP